MRKLLIPMAFAAMLTGCGNEAERFGYKGCDLEDDTQLYYTTAGGITNYVPMRVMTVLEKYELSAEEQKVVKAFGVLDPGVPVKAVPAGYACRGKEPWFATYVKNGVSFFDQKGTAGFLCHFDEDKGVYDVGEVFFSTYHKTLDGAKASLAVRRKLFAKNLRPLKFHDFADSFVSEYLRLRVISIFGKRPDGMYSCMTSIVDKNREGCGNWLPLDEQQEMLDSYLYSKAVKAWNVTSKKISEENHAAVQKACGDKGLKLFGAVGLGEASWNQDSQFVYMASGYADYSWPKDDQRRTALLPDAMKKATAGFGVTFGEVSTNVIDTTCVEYQVKGGGEFYDVTLSVSFSDPLPPSPPEAGAEGEKPAENAEPPEPPRVILSVSAVERMIGGRRLPPYPTMKRGASK